MSENIETPSLWKNKDFLAFVFLRFSLIFALFIQSTSVAYVLYQVTKKPIYIGAMGLAEFIPVVTMALFAGQLVDKLDKMKVVKISILCFMLASAILFVINFPQVRDLVGLNVYLGVTYSAFAVLGLTRSFSGPAVFSLLALVVRKENYQKAIPVSSSAFQIGSVTGPLAGGLILGYASIEASLGVALCMMIISFIFATRIKTRTLLDAPVDESLNEKPLKRIKEGLKFVFANPVILAALSLDMFAVFFGGAESLLPVFVKDILGGTSVQYGWLRSAHGIGSIIMLTVISSIPFLKDKVGMKLLVSVFLYGACIVMFGLSTHLWLSFSVLLFAGAFDAVSMVIRQSILQYKTPEHLKGRVSSVNNIFVSSSNELGAFESGVMAEWMGTVPSVLFGGSMTMIVVVFITLFIKQIRTVKLE